MPLIHGHPGQGRVVVVSKYDNVYIVERAGLCHVAYDHQQLAYRHTLGSPIYIKCLPAPHEFWRALAASILEEDGDVVWRWDDEIRSFRRTPD